MKATLSVARDLLREASARRWFLALGLAITGLVVVLGMALRMEVVDGALAATRLFGHVVRHDIRSAEGAMQPVFEALAYVVFYGGLGFGVLACSDFGAELLSPGRIEHLLVLPVRRWHSCSGRTWASSRSASSGLSTEPAPSPSSCQSSRECGRRAQSWLPSLQAPRSLPSMERCSQARSSSAARRSPRPSEASSSWLASSPATATTSRRSSRPASHARRSSR